MIIERDIPLKLQRDNSEEGTHVFLISDESVDSHNTVFRSTGWRFDEYRNNPIVTYGHPPMNSTDPDDVIGRSEVFQKDGKTYARVVYNLSRDKAKGIYNDVDKGFLNMCSIRAMVEDGEFGDASRGEDEDVLYFTNQRLIDWGVVMHASNKNAKASRHEIARSLNISPKTIEDEAGERLSNEDEAEERLVQDNSKLIERGKNILNKINSNK